MIFKLPHRNRKKKKKSGGNKGNTSTIFSCWTRNLGWQSSAARSGWLLVREVKKEKSNNRGKKKKYIRRDGWKLALRDGNNGRHLTLDTSCTYVRGGRERESTIYLPVYTHTHKNKYEKYQILKLKKTWTRFQWWHASSPAPPPPATTTSAHASRRAVYSNLGGHISKETMGF
jgi:hypothetical protein